jgi:hypothetical protein
MLLTAFITKGLKTSAHQIKTFSGTNSQEAFFKANDEVTICSTTEMRFPFLISQKKLNDTHSWPCLYVQNQNSIIKN